jgi:hypothetical protein
VTLLSLNNSLKLNVTALNLIKENKDNLTASNDLAPIYLDTSVSKPIETAYA